MLQKFVEEVRHLDTQIEHKKRDFEALDTEHKLLKTELEEYKLKDAKYN